MTREQYQQMRQSEVAKQKAEAEKQKSDPSLSPKERDRYEREYQALCQQQADWEKGGFWTANEDSAYKLNYQRYHQVSGSYRRSSV